VAGAVEHVVVVIAPLAARAGLVGLFKDEHGVVEARYFLHGQAARKASAYWRGVVESFGSGISLNRAAASASW
jgi:hypothetical protein